MELQPLGKNVLVAENKKSETSSGGIILEGGNHESKSATVIAVGPEVTTVAVGDIIFPDWANGHVIKLGGAQRAIIKEEAVLAKIA